MIKPRMYYVVLYCVVRSTWYDNSFMVIYPRCNANQGLSCLFSSFIMLLFYIINSINNNLFENEKNSSLSGKIEKRVLRTTYYVLPYY